MDLMMGVSAGRNGWEIILSSGALAAVIAGGISLWNSFRKNCLEYITAERKEWREKLKKIVVELQTARGRKLEGLLMELEMNLNSYGRCEEEYPENERLDIWKDEHIWKCLQSIHHTKENGERRREIRRLAVYMNYLMK